MANGKTALAKPDVDVKALAPVADFGQYAGSGYENQTAADIAIPFLAVLQKLSPALDKQHASFVKGAEEGQIINTLTREVVESLYFVPAVTQHCFVEWKPRAGGAGGFAGQHAFDSDLVKAAKADPRNAGKFGKLLLPNGNELVEQFYVYGIQVDADQNVLGQFVLPFASTNIAVYKQWMGKLVTIQIRNEDGKAQRPPLFAYLCKLSTAPRKNAQGSWFVFNVEAPTGTWTDTLLDPSSDAFQLAVATNEALRNDAVKVDYAAQERAGAGGGYEDADNSNAF